MLIGNVKAQLTQAMKENDSTAKGVLRVLLGKLQQAGKDDDNAVIATVKSLIKQNEEEVSTRSGNLTLPDGTVKQVEVSGQENDIARLNAEIVILKGFLPTFLSAEVIKEVLLANLDNIKAAPNAGAATGVAMKLLKSHGAVEGGTVKNIVTELYG